MDEMVETFMLNTDILVQLLFGGVNVVPLALQLSETFSLIERCHV